MTDNLTQLSEETGNDSPETCPKCGAGLKALNNIGRKNYIGCSNFPECRYTRQTGYVEKKQFRNRGGRESRTLGSDPATGLEVSIRWNRYGAFAQLGVESNPKRMEIPMEWDLDEITLDMALNLLALPREVGIHPSSGHVVYAGNGRYGPFLLHNGIHTSLDSIDEVFSVNLEQACPKIDKRESQMKRRWESRDLIRTIGEHPNGGPITMHQGRRSIYVRHRRLNANVPEEIEPEEVTVEQAVEFLNDKPWKPYKRRHSRF